MQDPCEYDADPWCVGDAARPMSRLVRSRLAADLKDTTNRSSSEAGMALQARVCGTLWDRHGPQFLRHVRRCQREASALTPLFALAADS